MNEMNNMIWVTTEAFGTKGRLVLPAMNKWMQEDVALARKTRQEGGPWPEPDLLQDRFEAWFDDGKDTILCDGSNRESLRLEVGVAMLIERPGRQPMPVFLQFDAGHLTPPAGLFDIDHASPLDGALSELGEKLILVMSNQVCYWSWENIVLCRERVDEYARENGLKTGGQAFPLEFWHPYDYSVILTMGDLHPIVVIWCEPDTGSLEVLFPLSAEIPTEVELRDGERSRSGQLLNRKVIECALTTKARAIYSSLGWL